MAWAEHGAGPKGEAKWGRLHLRFKIGFYQMGWAGAEDLIALLQQHAAKANKKDPSS
jgi:hypothetical protein